MNSLREIFLNLSLGKQQFLVGKNQLPIISCVRFYQKHEIPTPEPGKGKQFRRYKFIHFTISTDYRLCAKEDIS